MSELWSGVERFYKYMDKNKLVRVRDLGVEEYRKVVEEVKYNLRDVVVSK